VRATQCFDTKAGSVAAARRFAVAAVRDELGLDSEEVALIITELAANAVRHTNEPFEVIVGVDDGIVTVAVLDPVEELPVHRPPDAAGGRGLNIVAQLSDDWGADRLDDGKVVWAQLALGRAPRGGISPRRQRPSTARRRQRANSAQ
jgi:anti-sigma regulatory factor (Ser/Thr protein kinase)